MVTKFAKASIGMGYEIPQLEDDYYVARIKSVKEGQGKFGDDEFDQYIVEWELKEAQKSDGSNVTLLQWIRIPDGMWQQPPVLNPDSHLYHLLEAIGENMEEPECDPDMWPGKVARINVENKKIEKGQNAGQIRPRITGVKPLAGAAGARQQATGTAAPKAAAAPKRTTEEDW